MLNGETDDSADDNTKMRYANAANSMISFSHRAKLLVEDLSQRVVLLDIRLALHHLSITLKASKRQALKVLRASGLDVKSTSQVSESRESEMEMASQASRALEGRQYLLWNSHHHTKSWIDIIQRRNQLKHQTCNQLGVMLRECGVNNVGSLVSLSLDQLSQTLRARGVGPEEILPITQEISKIRSSFWNMRTRCAERSLWLLVREQYLRTEDLRLFYSVLDGNLVVSTYLMAALRDGLELLTFGLDRDSHLRLVKVNFSFDVMSDEGKVHKITSCRHFFSDQHSGDPLAPPGRKGKVSAETVGELLMAIRREIVHSLGWAPP